MLKQKVGGTLPENSINLKSQKHSKRQWRLEMETCSPIKYGRSYRCKPDYWYFMSGPKFIEYTVSIRLWRSTVWTTGRPESSTVNSYFNTKYDGELCFIAYHLYLLLISVISLIISIKKDSINLLWIFSQFFKPVQTNTNKNSKSEKRCGSIALNFNEKFRK